jgi:hypothetical protein
MNGDTYGEIIGDAMLGGDQEAALRKATCKMEASHRAFCQFCKGVLDQRTVHVLEKGPYTLMVLCPECAKAGDEAIGKLPQEQLEGHVWTTWDATIPAGQLN